MSAFCALLLRDFRLLPRRRTEIFLPLLFAFLVVSLFPLALGPDAAGLKNLAPGLLCIAALLTQFLGLERLFADDAESGALDLVALSPLPLSLYALSRMLARGAAQGLPLVLAAPILALMLNMDAEKIPALMAALALVSLCVTLAGGAVAALTLGARGGGGVALPLLLAPLCAPVLIFGSTLAAQGFGTQEGRQAVLYLGSLFFLYLALGPALGAAALRSAVEAS